MSIDERAKLKALLNYWVEHNQEHSQLKGLEHSQPSCALLAKRQQTKVPYLEPQLQLLPCDLLQAICDQDNPEDTPERVHKLEINASKHTSDMVVSVPSKPELHDQY